MSSSKLHPDLPRVSGRVMLGSHWSLELPVSFGRRDGDDGLLLWREDLSFWVQVWDWNRESVASRLQWVLAGAELERYAERIVRRGDIVLVTYELAAVDTRLVVSAYALAPIGSVEIRAFCESRSSRALAYEVLEGLSLNASTRVDELATKP
jgi:hypothetical protein